MSSIKIRFGLCLALALALVSSALIDHAIARSKSPKIEFHESLRSSLTNVLKRTNELSESLVERKDALVITRLRNLSVAIAQALETQDPDLQNKKHLDLILKDAKLAIDRVPRTQGEERRQNLQQAFRQLVLVAQTYVVDKQLKFYFCRRDRSVWFQKEGKPKNPINPESMGDCAQQVQ